MKYIMVITAAFLAAMVLLTGTGAATQITYNLTNSNVVEINKNVTVQVKLDNVAKTISVQLLPPYPSNPLIGAPLGIDIFYYNVSYAIKTVTGDIGWTMFKQSPIQASGFGRVWRGAQHPAGKAGISSPIVFTLTNTFTVPITKNDHGSTIVVHIRFANGCTGFISDGTVSAGSMKPCIEPVPIPEFPTIALPVAAVIGLLYLFQHRKRKEEKEE